MSSPILTADFEDVEYPESDGLPMADNTEQAFWMTFLFGGFTALFRKHADVFVAMNLFWYPVKGSPKIRTAPDVMIALGRPKGRRGSYKQWLEGDVAPHIAIEVRSPGNTDRELAEKLEFYDCYGVKEYYFFDPDQQELVVYLRQDGHLAEQMYDGIWQSPLLGVQFDMRDHDLRVIDKDGVAFQSIEELTDEKQKLAAERDRLLAQLRAAGIEPKP